MHFQLVLLCGHDFLVSLVLLRPYSKLAPKPADGILPLHIFILEWNVCGCLVLLLLIENTTFFSERIRLVTRVCSTVWR